MDLTYAHIGRKLISLVNQGEREALAQVDQMDQVVR